MTVFVVTMTDPSPALDKKSAEVAYILKFLDTVAKEIGRGQGTTTTGTVLGTSSGGTPNTALGSWTYTATATNP
jgi:hypothetical protein